MPRKYVLATNDKGRSDVVIAQDFGQEGAIDLWINEATPAPLTFTGDPTAGRTFLHEPPDGGAIFRIVTFAKTLNEITPEQMLEFHKALNSIHIPSLEELKAAKHPTMHRTDTLNYFILLSGELWMLSEERDVLLKPGDCIVQMGGMHGWRVESDDPAVLACVLVDALADEGNPR